MKKLLPFLFLISFHADITSKFTTSISIDAAMSQATRIVLYASGSNIGTNNTDDVMEV